MKYLATLSLILFFTLSTVIGQEKTNKSGDIIFHAIDKKEISATATKFESKIDLAASKLTISVPVESFIFKSSSMQEKLSNEDNLNVAKFPAVSFTGDIESNSEIEKDGRHIIFIKGEFTIKGITKPFKFNGLLENKYGATTFSAAFLIDPATFDLDSETAKKFTQKIEVNISTAY